MLIGDKNYRETWGFEEPEKQRMRDYLLGAVQAWCRDRHGEWFAARDLLGGADDDTLKSLRVVYVGMSRPRYLLCAAIQKDRFHSMDCQELREMWDVVEA